MNLTKNQKAQENQYEFPYHYLVEYSEDKVSLSKNWGWAIEYLGRLKLIIDTLKDKEFNSYLDIGCGDGKLISLLSQKYDKKFLGLDYSLKAIELAKIMNKNNSNLDYKVFDMFEDNLDLTFDIVSIVEVIEHIQPERLELFLQKSSLMLNKNGYFIGSVPSKMLKMPSKHYQHFDIDSLKIILNKSFEVKDIFYIDKKNYISKKLNFLANIINSSKVQNIAFNYYVKNCLYSKCIGEGIFFICQKRASNE